MRHAFLLTLTENFKFGGRLLCAIPCTNLGYSLLRFILFPLIWAAIFSLSLIHFVFFLVDEILFSAYRKLNIEDPIFIVGIPRSGTTWLQRVLANDKNLTTLTLAEAVFAPSISQRYILKAFSYLFKPLTHLLSRLPFQPLKRMDTIHKIRFSEPEEDFILFIPLHACFLISLLCPKSKHYWNLSRFDSDIPSTTQKIIMNFYALCVKKHLYFHGKELSFLSKNPSFTPFIHSLKVQFPTAHIIACTRKPSETVPSQLNSLKPTQNLIGLGLAEKTFNELMIELLLNYYKKIDSHKNQIHIVEMSQLNTDLESTVKKLYSAVGRVYGSEFAHVIKALSEKGRNYKSGHHYDLSAYHITTDDIDKTFSPYWPIEPNLI